MHHTSKQASSLVIVLLTIAASSVVILSGAGALINTARQRGSNESRNVANQMADSALQDGYYRFANATAGTGSLTSIGQYGTPAGQNLAPTTHGPKTGTNCVGFASDAETVDTNCATYQLAVRAVVTPETPSTGYTYTSQDFPVNQAIKIWLPSFTGSVTFTVTSCSGCSFTMQELNAAGTVIGGPYTVTNFQTVVNNQVRAVNITATNYNTAVNGTVHHNVMKVSSSTAFTVGVGFTTIEATGVAADGTTVRKLAIFRVFDTTSIGATPAVNKTLKTITQQFTPEGYCKPVADACR
ncbi:hypothetical protein BH11PAT4_BH11PAT4_3130 [soil metagenome]